VTAVKAIISGLLFVSVSMALSISGTVTDTAGSAIPGASVRLEKDGQTTTSGTDGSFTLGNITGNKGRSNPFQATQQFVAISNGFLRLNIQEKSSMEVVVYNLHGQAVSKAHKSLDAGVQSFALPRTGSGVFLYKVKLGNHEILLKSNSIDGVSGGASVKFQGPVSSKGAGKQAKISVTIDDVIAVTKSGFLNYRVIVTNSDTSGIEIKMIVCADTMIDADGNVYQAVRIGNQVWTVENLRTTKYNDGGAISLVTDKDAWNMDTMPKYCYYNNTTNDDSIKKFGALYSWYTVKTVKLAPKGWHVPTDAEWTILEIYLAANGFNWDGTKTGNKIAKSMAAKADWGTYTSLGAIGNDLTTNNRSGFSALPGGFRFYLGGNDFYGNSNAGGWWSVTEYDAWNARYIYLNSGPNDFLDISYIEKIGGFSVRLLRDSKNTFTIIPSVNDTTLGTITPSTPQLIDSGAASPKFIFKPKNGNRFDSLTIGGVRATTITLADTAYSIVSVLRNDTLKAWFTNIDTNTVTDIDGNIYHTAKIGNQVWTVENLRTTKYNDGTPITLDTSRLTWAATTGKYCYYDNTVNSDTIKRYGALYNWYAIETKKLAPTGWHVPTNAEWDTLLNYLIANGYNWDGTTDSNRVAKSMAAQTDWHLSSSPGVIGNNLSQNNRSGFTALPGGYRDNSGHFAFFHNCGYWWSATETASTTSAFNRILNFGGDYLVKGTDDKVSGFSVRVVKG
jgi:uncharacterized protein (TIGR02145 family)